MKTSLSEIEEAALRLKGVAEKTPLQFNKRLSEQFDAKIYLKREDQQIVRSFKIRGAYNKMSTLTKEEQKRGIVCASAGNHAQGVAFGCSALKIKGAIFMPAITPNQKIEKVKQFGGKYVEVILVGNTFDEASQASQNYCEEKGAVYVHPFNDPYTIAGQGTVGKEIYEQLEGKVDYVISCIGGGGIISGVSSYLKAKNENITVIGAEPNGAASMHASVSRGALTTLE
ncbi:pyridoxal-phosphate dependent enzyme, partial [Candidatus Roizmanbacteria bacterium]|nr:pyridoxal-phosphate dependent enzyme [Candidatus Roizmanbacteria bacterium]